MRRPWPKVEAARGNPAHLHKDSQKTGRPGHRAPHATLGWKNHTKPWFKSTLLLFLRLLFKYKKKKKKKRWPAKPFFSSSRKNRPQRMVYYRFTNTERGQHAHGWLGSGEDTSSCPGRMAHPSADVWHSPPGHSLFQIGRCTRDPATRTATPTATTRSVTGV